jgi:DNA-binding MarR family transcriptional regulator
MSTEAPATLQRVTAQDSQRFEHVGFALRLAYQRASANLTEAISRWDVTPVQFQALLHLSQRGTITQNELGRSIGMPPANIHRIVRTLRSADLVKVDATSADKRVTVLELTARGRQTLEALLPAADKANALTLSALGSDDQIILLDLLNKLANGPQAPTEPDER